MNTNAFFRGASIAVCTTVLFTLGTSVRPLRAADAIWSTTPTDGDWNDAANWGTGLPVAGDSLIFGESMGVTALNNDFAAGTSFNGITFDLSAPAFTVEGNGIVLGVPHNTASNPSSGNIVNNSGSLQTLGIGITLATGNHTIDGGASGMAFNPAGGLLRNPGATATFSGTLTTSTIANGTAGIIGGWATFGGTDWAAVDGSNQIVAYTGYTDVSGGGTIADGPTNNVRIPTAGTAVTLAAAGTTNINSLAYGVVGTAQVIETGLGNTLRLGAQGGILRSTNTNAGTFTLRATSDPAVIGGATLTAGGADNTPGEIVLNAARTASGTGTDISISLVIADNGEGVVSLVKTGRGYAAISASNTYTGGTFVNEGRLTVNASSGGLGSGDVTIQSGGQVHFGTNGHTYSNNFFIAGTGPQNESGLGAIRARGTVSGTITLMGNAGIASSNGNTATYSGKITDGGNGYSLTLGSLGNTGGAPATNIIVLSNTENDWGGNTILVSRTGSAQHGMVRLGNHEVIPHGAGKGNVTIGNSTVSTMALDLNGFNETLNGLDSGAAPQSAFIQNSLAASTSTLTLGASNAIGNFGGTIRDFDPLLTGGTVALTKIGTGEQILSGANTYTGDTLVNGGTLTLSETGSLGGTAHIGVANVGTLVLGNASSLNDAVVLSLVNGATLSLTFTGTETIGGLSLNGTLAPLGEYTISELQALAPGINFNGDGALLVVPEPGTVALAFIGLSTLLFRLRQRRL